jgi:MFS family permease
MLAKVQTFNALRYYQRFRFLLTSNFLYSVSFWMQLLVMSWLAYELTNSVFMVALFAAARMSPQLLGPFTGLLADRLNRRRLLIIARSMDIIFASTMALLISAEMLQFWHLLLFGFLGGTMMSVSYTAGSALAMDIVGKEDLTNAISLNVVAMDVTRVIGPAVGGALIAFLGPVNCFWSAAGLAVFAVMTLFFMEQPPREMATGTGSVWKELAAGLKYVIHSRDMLSVLLVTFVSNIFLWPAFQSFMPVFAKDNLGLDALGLGFLLTASGVGALAGALVISSMGNFKWKGAMYLYGTVLYAFFFGTFAISRVYPVALILIGLAGVASSAFMVLQSTLVLILAPEDMRGRSMGFLAIAIGILPFGCLAMGAAAGVIGASLATGIGCGITVAILIALAVGMPNLRRLG